MMSDITRVRGAMETISAGVEADSRDDIRWGDAWVRTMPRINVAQVVKSCVAVIRDGGSSRGEVEEAKLCMHIARGGWNFAKRIREVQADGCFANPSGERDPNLWRKLYSYHRSQFPQLEMSKSA